ncbi:hypothetical protein D3C71_1427270 [compost metagenome]
MFIDQFTIIQVMLEQSIFRILIIFHESSSWIEVGNIGKNSGIPFTHGAVNSQIELVYQPIDNAKRNIQIT